LSDEQPATTPRRRRIATIAVIAVLVVAADQVTKSLAVTHLAHHNVHVLGPISLRLYYNTGVAFSVGTGLTGPIIVIAIALVLVIAWAARGVPTMPAAVAFGLILGGAIGNLSDRLFRGHHGAVIDFVYSRVWPTFNLADSCIVVGSFLLAISFARTGSVSGRPPGIAPAESPGESPAQLPVESPGEAE
jgi:signal peptidase II